MNESLESKLAEGKRWASKKLEEKAFFGSVERYTSTGFTTPKISAMLDLLTNSLGGAKVLEQNYTQFVSDNKTQKNKIILYETANSIVSGMSGISTVKLANNRKEITTTNNVSEELLEDFVKNYKEADYAKLINSEQRVINYVVEYFNSIRNFSEQGLKNYSLTQNVFGNRNEQKVGISNSEKQTQEERKKQKTHNFSDVVGLKEQKKSVERRIFNPIQKKEIYNSLIKQPEKFISRKNFIFYGPPGTGKTYFARAIGGEINIPFLEYNATEFIQPLMGEGKNKLNKAYQEANDFNNAILFLDEADIICATRGSREAELKRDVINSMLYHLNGTKKDKNIITILSTNRIEDFDPAILSRFPKSNRLYFGPMSEDMKLDVIKYHLSIFNHENFEKGDLQTINDLLKDNDFRNISDIAESSLYYALEDNRNSILIKDVNNAIKEYQ